LCYITTFQADYETTANLPDNRKSTFLLVQVAMFSAEIFPGVYFVEIRGMKYI